MGDTAAEYALEGSGLKAFFIVSDSIGIHQELSKRSESTSGLLGAEYQSQRPRRPGDERETALKPLNLMSSMNYWMPDVQDTFRMR